MTRFLALILVVALSTFAANKNFKGAIVANQNDRPTAQAMPDSSGGQNDTLFLKGSNPKNPSDSLFNTSMFNSIRMPYTWDGMNGASSLIAKNPDSVVCNFVTSRVDADTGRVVYGIKYRLSPTTWSTYGGSSATDTNGIALNPSKLRVTAPWVAGKGFLPYLVTTTATDTTKIRFVECKDLVNP